MLRCHLRTIDHELILQFLTNERTVTEPPLPKVLYGNNVVPTVDHLLILLHLALLFLLLVVLTTATTTTTTGTTTTKVWEQELFVLQLLLLVLLCEKQNLFLHNLLYGAVVVR